MTDVSAGERLLAADDLAGFTALGPSETVVHEDRYVDTPDRALAGGRLRRASAHLGRRRRSSRSRASAGRTPAVRPTAARSSRVRPTRTQARPRWPESAARDAVLAIAGDAPLERARPDPAGAPQAQLREGWRRGRGVGRRRGGRRGRRGDRAVRGARAGAARGRRGGAGAAGRPARGGRGAGARRDVEAGARHGGRRPSASRRPSTDGTDDDDDERPTMRRRRRTRPGTAARS